MPKKLESKEAIKIMLKHDLKPRQKYINGTSRWESKCLKCGEINDRSLKSVIRHKKGCVYCSGKKVNPEAAEKWMLKNSLKPLVKYKKSNSPWKCKCLKCGRIVYPSYIPPSATKKPACAYCSKVRVDISQITAKMIKNGYKPLTPYKNSQTPWKCRCLKCGRIGYPRWSQIQWYDSKCQYCVGNKITERQAIKVMRKAGYIPLVPYVSSKSKWKSKHLKCGSIVMPKLNTITTGTGGCRNCADIGFEVNKSAYVYFLSHSTYKSYKVGIANEDSKPNRLSTHKKWGWDIVKIFQFDSGWDALEMENLFFRWLRKECKIPPHLKIEQMKQGGWSETFSHQHISSSSVNKKLTLFFRKLRTDV